MQPLKDNSSHTVGVIGMGLMGSAMACTLLRAGFSVGVFNRTPEKCRTAQEQGARIATTAAQLATESEFLIVMLSDDAAVEEIVLGERGILAGGREGLLVINSSTVHPATNQKLAQQLSERGIRFLDAPVTGSRPQAESGQLYFLVGGSEGDYQSARPLWEALGRGHIHLGPVGSGACAKLGNNLMGFINLSGLAEALELTRRFGLAPEKFLEAISNSGGKSAVSEGKAPKILSGNWSPDFALKLAAKDLRLAAGLAHELQQQAPILTGAAELYSRAAEKYGEADVCSLVRWYRESTAGN